MESFKNNDEIINFASEVLKWELPVTLGQADLDKLKLLAASALTHTHDLLKFGKKAVKPSISISELAKMRKDFRKPR